MNRVKIEELREKINMMIASDNYDYEELVELSQELDKYIVEEIKISMYVKTVLGCEVSEQFNNLINKIELVEENYEYVRIVDPIKKEVLALKGAEFDEDKLKCYKFFGRHDPCTNCVSIKSRNEYSIKIKIERVENKIYIVTAVPIQVKEKKLILELIKNVSLKPLMDMEQFKEKLINEELETLYSGKLIDDNYKVDLKNN